MEALKILLVLVLTLGSVEHSGESGHSMFVYVGFLDFCVLHSTAVFTEYLVLILCQILLND